MASPPKRCMARARNMTSTASGMDDTASEGVGVSVFRAMAWCYTAAKIAKGEGRDKSKTRFSDLAMPNRILSKVKPKIGKGACRDKPERRFCFSAVIRLRHAAVCGDCSRSGWHACRGSFPRWMNLFCRRAFCLMRRIKTWRMMDGFGKFFLFLYRTRHAEYNACNMRATWLLRTWSFGMAVL